MANNWLMIHNLRTNKDEYVNLTGVQRLHLDPAGGCLTLTFLVEDEPDISYAMSNHTFGKFVRDDAQLCLELYESRLSFENQRKNPKPKE